MCGIVGESGDHVRGTRGALGELMRAGFGSGRQGGFLRTFAFVLPALAAAACAHGVETDPNGDDFIGIQETSERVNLVQEAYCSVKVAGAWKETETDYLAHVIACENGGADLQALKAQAIAARSVAYYYMATNGSICDSQGCQVYSCGTNPSAIHYQAVAETAQQYLTYDNLLTYAFYVAGDSNASPPGCGDSGGATTKYVTNNSGKTGTAVKQTTLGWVGPPGFGQNRGCMSQWGARCLEGQGSDYLDILRHYYGADINITTAPGSCGLPTQPSLPSPAAASCGDGSCNNGEDCNSCAQDCGACPTNTPEPPPSGGGGGECGSTCGGQAASGCWCDDTCATYGDCCSDGSACSACGFCSNPNPQQPQPACGDGTCNGGESCGTCESDCGACSGGSTCSASGHQGSGENGESCSDPAETWRCVWIASWSAYGSQVCRYGQWTTFHLNPSNCAACCGSYDSGCAAW